MWCWVYILLTAALKCCLLQLDYTATFYCNLCCNAITWKHFFHLLGLQFVSVFPSEKVIDTKLWCCSSLWKRYDMLTLCPLLCLHKGSIMWNCNVFCVAVNQNARSWLRDNAMTCTHLSHYWAFVRDFLHKGSTTWNCDVFVVVSLNNLWV